MKRFICAMILLLILPTPTFANTTGDNIVISEIQTYGQTAKDEFIRLYNPTSSPIDISSWKLTKKTSSGSESNLVSSFEDGATIPANSGFLITHKTDYTKNKPADYTYSGVSYSIADNNTVLLYNNKSELVDKVGFGETSDFEDAPANNPEKGSSIKRNNNQDTDNNKNDFSPPPTPTYQGGETERSTPPPTPTYKEDTELNFTKFGDIVINRILPNPQEGEEWIEFFNTTGSQINLDSFHVYDGVGKIYDLSGTIIDYIIIEVSNRLNNAGDTVSLTDNTNKNIDVIAYGNWYDGNLEDNWPAPEKGEILSRNNKITTPKKVEKTPSSVILSDSEISYSSSYNTDVNSIQISEFLPNPTGSDMEGEWIELFNSSTSTDINIGGLYLDDNDGGSNPYKIPTDTIIKANNYILFSHDKTKLSLNNDYDAVRILDSNKNEILNIEYENAKEGLAYILIDDKWQWTSSPTPLTKNIISALLPLNKGELEGVSSASNYLTGTVIVPPNIFSTRTMYIDGKQLYLHSADWPELNVGDQISVWGVPSTYYNEPRLKLKDKYSIKIISKNNIVEPKKITAEDIDMDFVGQYIQMEGEILEIGPTKLLIETDSLEISIYKKENIQFPKLQEGYLINIAGILSISKDDFRIIPTKTEDIKILKLAEVKPSQNIENKNMSWYYISSTLLFSALLGGTIIQRRKKNATAKPATPTSNSQKLE